MNRRGFIKSVLLGAAALAPWPLAPARTVTIPAGAYTLRHQVGGVVWERVAETDAWNESITGDIWADDCGKFVEEL